MELENTVHEIHKLSRTKPGIGPATAGGNWKPGHREHRSHRTLRKNLTTENTEKTLTTDGKLEFGIRNWKTFCPRIDQELGTV